MSNDFVNATNLSSQKALNHSYSADGSQLGAGHEVGSK